MTVNVGRMAEAITLLFGVVGRVVQVPCIRWGADASRKGQILGGGGNGAVLCILKIFSFQIHKIIYPSNFSQWKKTYVEMSS